MSSPAQQPSPADLQAESLARDIAGEMPSPYCPGRSIASCPSEYARELEDDILVLAKQGKDRKQIESVLVERFGEEKMGSAAQSEIVVTILLAAVIGLAAIMFAARKWLRPASAATTATGPAADAEPLLTKVSADELDRLEDELDGIDHL
jgi:cytochrome c-type biogenesis protein CcmH/NrfF